MYTCPMHPEIKQETPGRCPRCHMQLVEVRADIRPQYNENRGLGVLSWRNYLPLIAIIGLIVVAAAALALKDYWTGNFSIPATISYFMAGFFLVFAGFKLIDLPGFADGYGTYDLLAMRAPAYGYVYPFIELAFGLAMLIGFQPLWLLWSEFGVMALSGLGVTLKLAKGEKFQCVCLGTFLKVPLTKITLVEDFGMALLALVLIYFYYF